MMANARLYSVRQVQALDQRTIEQGVPGFALMLQAGQAALDEIIRRWPQARRLCIFCGSGNNAGDGYVVAALAHRQGLEVQLVALRPPDQLQNEAGDAVRLARESGVRIDGWHQDDQVPTDTDVVVDALLGTGTRGEIRAPFDSAIARINAAQRPVVALDIPSGLNADTGALLGEAVRADLTVTFIARKFGLYTGQAPDVTGEIVLAPLSVSEATLTSSDYTGELLLPERLHDTLPRRRPTTHKGDCGHLLVVGGQPGFGGSTIMSAETAARLGAGLVSLATAAVHAGHAARK